MYEGTSYLVYHLSLPSWQANVMFDHIGRNAGYLSGLTKMKHGLSLYTTSWQFANIRYTSEEDRPLLPCHKANRADTMHDMITEITWRWTANGDCSFPDEPNRPRIPFSDHRTQKSSIDNVTNGARFCPGFKSGVGFAAWAALLFCQLWLTRAVLQRVGSEIEERGKRRHTLSPSWLYPLPSVSSKQQ